MNELRWRCNHPQCDKVIEMDKYCYTKCLHMFCPEHNPAKVIESQEKTMKCSVCHTELTNPKECVQVNLKSILLENLQVLCLGFTPSKVEAICRRGIQYRQMQIAIQSRRQVQAILKAIEQMKSERIAMEKCLKTKYDELSQTNTENSRMKQAIRQQHFILLSLKKENNLLQTSLSKCQEAHKAYQQTLKRICESVGIIPDPKIVRPSMPLNSELMQRQGTNVSQTGGSQRTAGNFNDSQRKVTMFSLGSESTVKLGETSFDEEVKDSSASDKELDKNKSLTFSTAIQVRDNKCTRFTLRPGY